MKGHFREVSGEGSNMSRARSQLKSFAGRGLEVQMPCGRKNLGVQTSVARMK